MNSWRPYPLLRLLFPFTAGIIIDLAIGPPAIRHVPVISALVFLLLSIRMFSIWVPGYGYRWISGLMINVFLLIAGYGVAESHRLYSDPAWIGRHPDGMFLATLDEPPATNARNVKTVLRVRYRHEQGRWERSCGLVLAYLQLRPGSSPLQYGDFILLNAGFTGISDNSNPHAFNYSAYLKNRGVTHRVFAEPHDWTRINLRPTGFFRRVAFQLRDRLLNILRENHVEGKEFAVASALLLGYVNDLDAGLRKDYAATGAMHILSVSGMHVGIIYIFLEFMLGFLNRSKPGRFAKAVILLVFIWFYALLTGLSPCVLRSAAMLSLPILGKSLNRSPDMFNIIAASVIFILAMDPFLVTDLGFQLSYLAVIGIVILYKPIYDLYVTSAWLPDKIWSILAISIAAQLATLPITLYTFHQFPNYFMLTNIFVVPLSSLIIYAGIFVLAIGTVPIVSILSAKALIFMVWLLNTIIHFIEELPFSTIKGIFISTPEMLLLYFIIGTGFLFLTLRRTFFLWLFLVVSIALVMSVAGSGFDRLRSTRFLVFNAPHAALYEFSVQNRAVIFYNTRPLRDWTVQKFNQDISTADLDAHGIKYRRYCWTGSTNAQREEASIFMPVIHYGNFFQFGSHRVGILNKKFPRGFRHCTRVEYLIISGNPNITIADAVRVFHPRKIIIDATNSRYRTVKWMSEAAKLAVSCHAVTIHGAFEKEF
jgi:competence protein ComEC